MWHYFIGLSKSRLLTQHNQEITQVTRPFSSGSGHETSNYSTLLNNLHARLAKFKGTACLTTAYSSVDICPLMGQTIETKPTHTTFKSIMYNTGVVTGSLLLCLILFKGLRKQSEDEAYQVFLLQLFMSRTPQLRSSLQSNMASPHCTVGAPIHNSPILNLFQHLLPGPPPASSFIPDMPKRSYSSLFSGSESIS